MSKELEFKRKYSVNAIKLLLTEHTSKKKYLQNIIDGEERQNFKGEVTHTITDEQKEAAQARLDEEDFIA
jgi:sRNA-binding protein